MAKTVEKQLWKEGKNSFWPASVFGPCHLHKLPLEGCYGFSALHVWQEELNPIISSQFLDVCTYIHIYFFLLMKNFFSPESSCSHSVQRPQGVSLNPFSLFFHCFPICIYKRPNHITWGIDDLQCNYSVHPSEMGFFFFFLTPFVKLC